MDVRSQRTRQLISDAFMELLEDKPAAKITVTEICQKANINRATFYKHYLDVPDLHEQLEQKILKEFEEFVQGKVLTDAVPYREMLVELLDFSARFGSRYYILCTENAASDLPAKSFQMLNSLVFPLMKERIPSISDQEAAMLYQFVSHGSGSMLVQWLRRECNWTAEQMADFIMLISGAAVQSVLNRRKEQS